MKPDVCLILLLCLQRKCIYIASEILNIPIIKSSLEADPRVVDADVLTPEHK